MFFEIRGVVVRRDAGDKFVKVVARVDHNDIYKSISKKANVAITRQLIMDYATGHYGIPAEQIIWPHHVEVNDI